MAKFGIVDLKLGGYDDLFFSSNTKFLQNYINKSGLINVNYKFAYENFNISPTLAQTDPNGVTSVNVYKKIQEADGMADFKSPMAQNTGIDQNGSIAYSASIGNFGKALNPVTAMDREKKEKIIAQFGDESPLVLDYVEQVQTLVNYMDSTLSYMAGKIISTGKFLEPTGMYAIDCKIPAENFVKAGDKRWGDASADIVGSMNAIETAYRERTGDLQPMKWQIPLNMWRENFLTNTNIKAKINELRTLRELPTTSGNTVIEEWVMQYFQDLGVTSPIEIAKEGEVKVGLDTRTPVKGWDDKIAVLRPIGYAGEIVRGDILKAYMFGKYASKSVTRQIAYLNNGLYALINSVYEDANGLPIMKTDIEAACAPVLTETPAHIIVDTQTAN